MNTTTVENKKNLCVAMSYFNAILAKDFETMASCLQDNVHFISPLAERHGKDEVILAAKGISQILYDIKIRSKFADENQVMIAYDFISPEPLGQFRVAVLMEFTNQLISKIEAFYDGQSYAEKKKEVLLKK